MRTGQANVVVAGHICLDIIPEFPETREGAAAAPPPGKLAIVGPAEASTGGCVSNTGLALHKLGISTALLGKVGDDLLGRATIDFIRQNDELLAESMIVSKGEKSSYTIVVNPSGVDRSFMHFPGPNDTFVADDLDYNVISGARLFHFGYPPLMRAMFEDNGKELIKLFKQVKDTKATTSLDMAQPDPQSPAGQADWLTILKSVLPYVDIFLPSLDEILYMLGSPYRERFEAAQAAGEGLDYALCAELSEALIEMGVAIVCLKMGDHGLYLRSTADLSRLEKMGKGAPIKPGEWRNRELMAPCYQVKVAGATGSGDCTIAGFLAAWTHELTPAQIMNMAAAVGASSVEQKDATSGVRTWEETIQRMQHGWPRRNHIAPKAGWRWDAEMGVWIGPCDCL